MFIKLFYYSIDSINVVIYIHLSYILRPYPLGGWIPWIFHWFFLLSLLCLWISLPHIPMGCFWSGYFQIIFPSNTMDLTCCYQLFVFWFNSKYLVISIKNCLIVLSFFDYPLVALTSSFHSFTTLLILILNKFGDNLHPSYNVVCCNWFWYLLIHVFYTDRCILV